MNKSIKGQFSPFQKMDDLRHLIFGKSAYKSALVLGGTTYLIQWRGMLPYYSPVARNLIPRL